VARTREISKFGNIS